MKRPIDFKQAAKWLLFSVLTCVGIFGFILLIGEENPEAPISAVRFLLLKVLGFACMAISFIAGIIARERGYLPNIDKYFKEDNYVKR